ncbi:MAG: hypothetical protein RHS_3908 [Robinsoniella sp. RHS]|uniref:response regulator n=1 Tax=Robinsoniella sp. RHS TaxID=1504536 RepID=UPI00064936DB|nr:MAG: hypothetical protein RHS_3908 [Robinsoniella sp. RHS]
MIMVIVVDDEKVIREGIGRFVKETEGFELLQTCENGVSAYDAIREKKPDLVICDIMMPKWDGIQLIGACREQDITCEFVLLSGYSEFEYARAAIRYQVLDYINKPINPALLKKMLEDAQRVIGNKNKIRKKLQSTIYDKVLEEEVMSADEEHIEQLQQQMPHRVLAVNGYDGGKNGWDTEKVRIYCDEILQKQTYEQYIVYNKNGLIIIILVGVDTREHAIEKIWMELLAYAKGQGGNAAMGIGDTVSGMREIPTSYRKAKAALYEAQCREDRCCLFERLPYTYKSPGSIYARDISVVESALHLQNREQVLEVVQETADRYKISLPPYVIYSFIQKCAKEIWNLCEENTVLPTEFEQKDIFSKLTAAPDTERLMERFYSFAVPACKALEQIQGKHYGGTIDEVINYIHLNYTQDISTQKICSVFYFNQSYFSALFKSKTGSNYNDYVTNLRIAKAKELLKSGNYKISEISAMIGYNSSRYFSKVFRARTGELPQEYKNHFLNK